MVSAELRKRLGRSLEHVFQEPSIVIDTFSNVFDTYPLEILQNITDEEHLEDMLSQISEWRAVKDMQEWIDLEIAGGQETLDTAVLGIVLNNLPQAGIIPRSKLDNIRDHSFQEIWAYVREGERIERAAMGLFPISQRLEDIVFTPDTVFYNEGLKWNVRPGEKPTLHLHDDIFLRRIAKAIVFSEEVPKSEARSIIKKIINYMVKNNRKPAIRKNPYQVYENRIVDGLRSVFPDIINENRSINYENLYRIFRLVRRRNISLGTYMREGDVAGKLSEAIERFVPLPYAVVSTRTKQRERAFEKIIEAFYDLRTEGYQGGEKSFRDLYGIRVMLPTPNDIYKFLDRLKATLGVKIVKDEKDKPIEKDYIKKPKPNGYRGYHITIQFAGREYDVQLRTHEMDYMAERNPKQAHEGRYKEEKINLIGSTPLPVRRVVGTLLGLYTPTKKAA